MTRTPQTSKNSIIFWLIYGLAILIISIGCVAGDDTDEIGEIGVCGSSAEHWGEERGQSGALGFYHALNANDLTSNPLYYQFNPLVVSQSFSTYYVSHWSTGEPARVVDATSSNPDIISIAPLNQSNQTYFDIEAIRPGEAEITIYTALGNADRIRLIVTDLNRVDANHCCSDSTNARYLTNSEVELPVSYQSSRGERALGFGILPYDVSDPTKLEWLAGVPDPSDLHFITGDQAGEVTLTPRISGNPVTMELIKPDDVDGITPHWEPDAAYSNQWFVGAVLYENNTAICAGKYPMRVTTKTPNICDLISPDNQPYRSVEFAADETVLVRTYQDEECELEFELFDERGQIIHSETSSKYIEDDLRSDYDSGPY